MYSQCWFRRFVLSEGATAQRCGIFYLFIFSLARKNELKTGPDFFYSVVRPSIQTLDDTVAANEPMCVGT